MADLPFNLNEANKLIASTIYVSKQQYAYACYNMIYVPLFYEAVFNLSPRTIEREEFGREKNLI